MKHWRTYLLVLVLLLCAARWQANTELPETLGNVLETQ